MNDKIYSIHLNISYRYYIMNELSINLINESSGSIGFDYEYYLYSSMLSMVEGRSKEFSRTLHDFNDGPLFNLGPLIPVGRGSINEKGFSHSAYIFIIRSNRSDIINELSRILLIGDKFESDYFKLKILSMETKDIKVNSQITTLYSISPIILRDSNRKFIRPDEQQYELILKQSIERRSRKIHDNSDLSVKSLKLLNFRNKLKHLHGVPIPCSILKFDIWADNEIIQDIIESGIGMKNQLGFGMVNMV